jgi:hypothetical protein
VCRRAAHRREGSRRFAASVRSIPEARASIEAFIGADETLNSTLSRSNRSPASCSASRRIARVVRQQVDLRRAGGADALAPVGWIQQRAVAPVVLRGNRSAASAIGLPGRRCRAASTVPVPGCMRGPPGRSRGEGLDRGVRVLAEPLGQEVTCPCIYPGGRRGPQRLPGRVVLRHRPEPGWSAGRRWKGRLSPLVRNGGRAPTSLQWMGSIACKEDASLSHDGGSRHCAAVILATLVADRVRIERCPRRASRSPTGVRSIPCNSTRASLRFHQRSCSRSSSVRLHIATALRSPHGCSPHSGLHSPANGHSSRQLIRWGDSQ